MLRKLILVPCLFVCASTVAQTTKIKEKQEETEIDHKQVGAPMPPLRMLLYEDTSKKNKNPSLVTSDVHEKKKKKGKHEDRPAGITKMITASDVDNGANLFVMIFNPTCSHCEDETVMLEKNMPLFKKSKILLMAAPGMMPYLGDFVKRLGVDEYPQMSVGVDSSGFVNNIFLYQALPQMNIYNADRKLLRIWSGEVSIDSLKQYIQ